MNFARARLVADALLYEGYLLYPYRPSSLKNRQRWTFGGLSPRVHGELDGGLSPFSLGSECLVEAEGPAAELEARVRFLQPLQRRSGAAWQQACERQVESGPLSLAALVEQPHRQSFMFATSPREKDFACAAIEGVLEITAVLLAPRLYKLSLRVLNLTPMASPQDGEAARLRTLDATHLLLGVRGGGFVSLLEPPEPLRAAAEACRHSGAWPVLLGEAGARDLLLCSPIILYDYPAVAPESPGDLCDATEIDEMLRLRILTLTAEEQRELAASDERARRMLEQTARMQPDELLRLHGAPRPAWDLESFQQAMPAPPASLQVDGAVLRPGDRVALRPRRRADVFDLALAGRAATIASIEQDFEGRLLLTVTLDDDPGRDLGVSGLPGHRFFFHPDEVEPLAAQELG